RGEGCAALAEAAAQRVRTWAAAHGAWREGGALPQPPLVSVPDALPPLQPEVRAPAAGPAPPPGSPFGLPFRVGLGAGAGAQLASAGGTPGFEAWLLAGPPHAPFWGELVALFTPQRILLVDRFAFGWNRGLVVMGGGVYRFSRAPLEVVAGL